MSNHNQDWQPGSDHTAVRPHPRFGNPIPIAVGLLGVQVMIFAAEWIGVTAGTLGERPLATAVVYSTLAAGVAQFVAGVIALLRGDEFSGQISGTVGLWLIGFYFLLDHKAEPLSLAWYLVGFDVLLLVFLIPAIMRRRVTFIVVFSLILLMVMCTALGLFRLDSALTSAAAVHATPNVGTTVTLLRLAGWVAIPAAASLFVLMMQDVVREARGRLVPSAVSASSDSAARGPAVLM